MNYYYTNITSDFTSIQYVMCEIMITLPHILISHCFKGTLLCSCRIFYINKVVFFLAL